MRLLYSALFYALTPFVLGRLAWRGRKLPAYRARWQERFARYNFPPEPGSVWFHAVSVGEAEAAFPLIRQFQARVPARKILVTCTTPTGSARIQAVLGESIRHVYLPYDLPDVVGRFMEHFQPALAVIMETEIWPNLYRECARHGIPLAIVNGRLSEKSARRYRKIRGLTADSLAAVSLIAAQTTVDAERYAAIGADPDKIVVAGNVKFDLEFSDAMREQATALRAELFGTRPVWIAGSTHPGEEEQILAAHRVVRQTIPDALLAVAPRHPDRFEDALALCVGAGFSVRRRGERRPCDDSTEVFLIDSLGELRLFYAASDLAFVGGSLVPRGGHNVLEPAAAGCPVLFGPHMFNFAEIAERLMDSGGGEGIGDAGELGKRVAHLLAAPDSRRDIGAKGRAFVEANRGAVRRVMDRLAALLP
ncbi:lipid IV(A) 3-deoxy-D-manno-octulosonic acid transferase [Methylomagnum sp.]